MIPLRQFVHIPKTGGSALRQALGLRDPNVRFPGHRHPVSAFSKEDDVFTIVREPVDRFVSAFWHVQPVGWEQPGHLAEKMPDSIMHMLVFRPQVEWIDADRELLWVGYTETLDADYQRLKALLLGPVGELQPRPPSRYQRPILSAKARGNLREYYAADYALLGRVLEGGRRGCQGHRQHQ